MNGFQEFIRPELLVLIPVLYVMGNALKKSSTVMDKHIPLVLGYVGIFLALIYTIAVSDFNSISDFMMIVFVSITQGVLCAGSTVYTNQIIKQESQRKE